MEPCEKDKEKLSYYILQNIQKVQHNSGNIMSDLDNQSDVRVLYNNTESAQIILSRHQTFDLLLLLVTVYVYRFCLKGICFLDTCLCATIVYFVI